jgi:hypothetical protein
MGMEKAFSNLNCGVRRRVNDHLLEERREEQWPGYTKVGITTASPKASR